jgi:small subunit ribosomal protein S17
MADETTPEADETTPEAEVEEAPAAEPVAEEATTAPAPKPAAVKVAPATDDSRINRRKVREGLVISVSMDKTAVVGVIERVRHPRYAKTVQRTKRLYAHVPNNDLRVGDRVRLAETRPVSKLKRWRVVDVLERAK